MNMINASPSMNPQIQYNGHTGNGQYEYSIDGQAELQNRSGVAAGNVSGTNQNLPKNGSIGSKSN
jgi:hypothetical protein